MIRFHVDIEELEMVERHFAKELQLLTWVISLKNTGHKELDIYYQLKRNGTGV